MKKYNIGKKIQTIKSGEFVLHQLYNQKKNNISLSNIKRNSISSRDKVFSQCQSQKHIINIDVESFSEIDELESEYINNNHIMTEEEEKNLRNSLQNLFVFRDITPELLNFIIEECVFCTFNKGKIIYQEGEEGNFFYVISKGTAKALEKGKFKKKI